MLLRLTLAFALLIPTLASAQADDVRTQFQRAYSAANTAAGDADSDALRNYILYPYLEQARIRFRLLANEPDANSVDREAAAFLVAHDKEVVSFDLRRTWYPSLARRLEWEALIANYRDVNDPAIQCSILTGRIALQRFE